MGLREDADQIIRSSLRAVQPEQAVQRALKTANLSGDLYLAAVGKAAWQMAKAACELHTFREGIVITKYGHSMGDIKGIKLFEAGHPVPDKNTFAATEAVLKMTDHLTDKDTVVFLLSGGGSSLFELPLVPESELTDITQQLLACGAGIVEMNTIRKRLSKVKGGRFAWHCFPARVFSVVLSDIVGDPLDMIASGPAVADCSTCEQAMSIVKKYHLNLSACAMSLLKEETPKKLANVETHITGSVRQLCEVAAKEARELGYEAQILTDSLTCTARDGGSFLASIARYYKDTKHSLAFLAGGETVVKVTGTGIGGRNQELALAAAEGLAGLRDTAVFSIGSDGTDGPTDAAGGYVDQDSLDRLNREGISVSEILQDNNAYVALQSIDGLIITGPTGTNVNDVSVLLIRR